MLALLWAALFGGAAIACAGEAALKPAPVDLGALPMPDLGRLQPWGDELLFRQWRIQRHAGNGRYRLVDGDRTWLAADTFDECRIELDRIRRTQRLPPMKGTAVLVLHGLARSRTVMAPLCKYLEEHSDYVVLNVEYPGTQQSIGADARQLASVIAHLDGIDEIHFVAHSMGNLVVRHYLGDQTDPRWGRRPDPRIRRMVMLGPPNHGSTMAAAMGDNAVMKMLVGRPLDELGRHWTWAESNLAVPQFEFGIIAGGLGNTLGFNPFLRGDDDGVVSLQSTRLAGAADFLVVPLTHLRLLGDPRVFQYTLRSLQHGYFISPRDRRPIPAAPAR